MGENDFHPTKDELRDQGDPILFTIMLIGFLGLGTVLILLSLGIG